MEGAGKKRRAGSEREQVAALGGAVDGLEEVLLLGGEAAEDEADVVVALLVLLHPDLVGGAVHDGLEERRALDGDDDVAGGPGADLAAPPRCARGWAGLESP